MLVLIRLKTEGYDNSFIFTEEGEVSEKATHSKTEL